VLFLTPVTMMVSHGAAGLPAICWSTGGLLNWLSMKLRHAAALALVLLAVSMAGCSPKAFWLLMVPPIHGGQVDISAPLKSWTTMYHPFRSLSECEQMRQSIIAFSANKQDMEKMQKMLKNFGAGVWETTKTLESHATCVASDDSRLTAN